MCSRLVHFVLRPKRKVKGQTPKSGYLVEPKRKEKGQTPKSRIIRLVYVYLWGVVAYDVLDTND